MVDPEAKDTLDAPIVDDVALMPESGVAGTIVDLEDIKSTTISVYTVHKGDSLSDIAKMFKVSVNTIAWANDITNGKIKEGEVLIILPVTGISHVVKKGDTVASIAKKYKADIEDVIRFNNISASTTLAVGSTVVVPDGEMSAPIITPSKKPTSNPYRGGSGPDYCNYYIRPIVGGVLNQGIHGYNGVDLASSEGADIFAAASGAVIISRNNGGWNGGYGNYVVISHPNGTQTLYGHLKDVAVSVGDIVTQGQVIGFMGHTGKVVGHPGTHLHFEVRGARNPFQ